MLSIECILRGLFDNLIFGWQSRNFRVCGDYDVVILGSVRMMKLVNPWVFVLLWFRFFPFFFWINTIASTISTTFSFLQFPSVIKLFVTIILLRLSILNLSLIFLGLLFNILWFLLLFSGLLCNDSFGLILFGRVFDLVYFFLAHHFSYPIKLISLNS